VTTPKVIRVRDALTTVQRLLAKLIGEHVELVIGADPDLWPTLIDPAQLEQVLMNLAVNARDAMPRGGRLTIHASNVPSDPRVDELGADHVLIRVADTGHGMDDETRRHVFDPFFTTKEVGQGTGLGLAIVHGVVEKHGGRVTVQSAPGQGTEFGIYLPRAEEGPALAPRGRHSDAPKGHERVLLVEDEGPVRALAVRILEHQGYTVLSARNGEEALEAVRASREPIALVITDVVMPKLDGQALATRLKALRPEIRVLLVSGYTADHTAIDGPFLAKPYTPDALSKKVREVLDPPD
jgi:CheY-like chemotaxis protein